VIVPPEALWPELDRDLVVARARDFVEENRAFFGAGTAELSGPEILQIPRQTLVTFAQQTESGLAVRGANLRLLLSDAGELLSAKAYLVRDVDLHWQASAPADLELLSRDEVLETVLAGEKDLRHSTRLELVFPSASPTDLLPAWRVKVFRDESAPVEEICDASSAEVLARCEEYKAFDYFVTNEAFSGSLDDASAPWNRVHLEVPQEVAGVVLTRGEGDAVTVVAQADAQGEAVIDSAEETLTLTSSLAYGPRQDCDPSVEGLRCSSLHVRWAGGAAAADEDGDDYGDRIPDLRQTRKAGETFSFLHYSPEDRDDRLFWVFAFRQGVETLRMAERDLSMHGEGHGSPRLSPLEICPVLSQSMNRFFVGADGVHVAQIASSYLCVSDPFDLSVSVLNHELGHHVITGITGSTRHTPVEEGAADLLHALRFHASAIGTGAAGFVLGTTSPCDLNRRSARIRADVGAGFWALYDRFDLNARREPVGTRVRELYYRWLATNRVRETVGLTFGDEECVLDELLTANRLVGDPLSGAAIRDVFPSRFNGSARFVRGDTNLDRKVEISDPISTLAFLFQDRAAKFQCADAMDADDDGAVNITDAVITLQFLFLGGKPPVAPYPDCGGDTTPDGLCCIASKAEACQRVGDP